MNLRSALKSGASRFAHLSAIPSAKAKSAGKAEDDEAKKGEDDEAKKADDKKPEGKAEASPPDDDEEDDDEKEDNEECKNAEAAGHGKALKTSRRAGAHAERKRCAAIFLSQHAAGRIPLACELAFGSDTKAEDAIRILSAAQPEGGNALAAALAAAPKHSIGDGGTKGKEETPGNKLMSAMKRLDSAKAANDPVDRLAAAVAERIIAR